MRLGASALRSPQFTGALAKLQSATHGLRALRGPRTPEWYCGIWWWRWPHCLLGEGQGKVPPDRKCSVLPSAQHLSFKAVCCFNHGGPVLALAACATSKATQLARVPAYSILQQRQLSRKTSQAQALYSGDAYGRIRVWDAASVQHGSKAVLSSGQIENLNIRAMPQCSVTDMRCRVPLSWARRWLCCCHPGVGHAGRPEPDLRGAARCDLRIGRTSASLLLA